MIAKTARHNFSEFGHLSIRDRRRAASRYSTELVIMAGLVPAIHGTDLELVLIDLASDLESLSDEMAAGKLGAEIIARAATLVLLMQRLSKDTPVLTMVH